MQKKDFFHILEEKLKNNNIYNMEDIIEDYKDNFNKLKETLDEEEVINSFGDIDDIIAKYINNKPIYNVKIKAQNNNVNIHFKNTKEIDVSIKNGSLDNFKIKNENNNFEMIYQDNIFKIGTKADLSINIPNNINIDLEISTTSGDVIIDKHLMHNIHLSTVSGDMKLNEMSLRNLLVNTVSGDFYALLINGYNVKLRSVSGDYRINNLKTNKLSINTVSGDAIIKENEIDNIVNCNSISGSIIINGKDKAKSIKNFINNLRGKNKDED